MVMVSRLTRASRMCLLATAYLLMIVVLVCRTSAGQEKKESPKLPSVPKADPKIEADRLLQKAFGTSSDELRRPIRLAVPDFGIAIAAEEFSVTRDSRVVRLATISVAVIQDVNGSGSSPEINVHHGDDALITLDHPATQWSELRDRQIMKIEVRGKQSSVILTATAQRNDMATAAALENFLITQQRTVVAQEFIAQAVKEEKKEAELKRSVATRFKFTFDPQTPLSALLPAPAKVSSKLPPPLNEDLSKVPELSFGEPISKAQTKTQAIKETAHAIAKVNHLNQQKIDGFMEALISHRADLRGMPFLMGQECRTCEEQARIFASIAERLNQSMRNARNQDQIDIAEFLDGSIKQVKGQVSKTNLEYYYRASVAAAVQILMPESERFRVGLARYLAAVPHVDATRALARLALFSAEDEVRAAAIEGLKLRREKDYADVLLAGFQYPLAPVAKRAAEAFVKLDRKDLVANLVDVLDQADPRLPVKKTVEGKEVAVVRELVRVNHNRSCVLCHAPGNTENVPEGGLTVAVPLPTEPLPKPSDGGYQSVPPPSPDIVVRLDMTYLRQDFSMMMPVSDPHPWPEKQRFDFFVRARVLTAQEAQAYEPCCEADEPGRLSPYHRAALYALRELTGRDAAPTAAAWRTMLKLPAAQP
jgi:hypothetical protein